MVTQETNWADEMDVFGFSIMFQDEWNEHIDYAKKYFEKKDTFCASLGTNEDIYFDGYDDWRGTMNVKLLSISTAKELLQHFNAGRRYNFGKFISPLDYDDGIFDEEDLVPVQEKTQEEKNEEWNQKELIRLRAIKPGELVGYDHYKLLLYRQRLIGDLQSLTSSDQEVLAEYNRILDKKDENSA